MLIQVLFKDNLNDNLSLMEISKVKTEFNNSISVAEGQDKDQITEVEKDKFSGLGAGLTIGDALGAKYESGALERLYWSFVSKTKAGKWRYTDDTEMSVALADHYLRYEKSNLDILAKDFSNAMSAHRGYGAGTRKFLIKIKKGWDWQLAGISIYKQGSYGNGAAMRAPIVAAAFHKNTDEEFTSELIRTSRVTHSHQYGVDGALLIGFAVRMALKSASNEDVVQSVRSNTSVFDDKIKFVSEALLANKLLDKSEVIKNLGNGITAHDSVVTALYFSLKYRDLDLNKMLDEIFSLGGDTDTIGSMAGAIWGAFNGLCRVDIDVLNSVESGFETSRLVSALHDR